MELEFSITDKFISTLMHYIKEMLDRLPIKLHGSAATPTAKHLFTICNTAAKSDSTHIEFFIVMMRSCYFYASRHVHTYRQLLHSSVQE